jgi:glycosyltransferase involved in cell wall biosynthesis
VAIHLLNPLWDASGGSEWRTLNLFKLLSGYTDVSILTEYTPDPQFLGKFPIQEMQRTKTYPRTGTFVFVGVYWEFGEWLRHARPDRVILIYNIVDPEGLAYRLDDFREFGIENVELRFASEMLAQHAGGRRGTVEYSPIDLENLVPKPKSVSGRPVIGRHSRDQRFKHHSDDPAFYRKLVRDGFDVKLMGGTCLEELSGEQGIELLPVNSVPVHEFLQSLDIFFYRTDPAWTEAYGRVIAEAMACGLPCVAESAAGYNNLIESGESGYLFDTEGEAQSILLRLQDDPELRARIGGAARSSITELYERETQNIVRYYLGSAPLRP